MSKQGQQGVALIVVLMLVAVLGLLMLQLSLTAKANTARAQNLLDRTRAELGAQSALAELTFSLLTNNWVIQNQADTVSAADELVEAYPARWNFRGESFSVGNTVIQIQDLSGLLPVPLPGQSMATLASALRQTGVEPDRADRAARVIEAMQREEGGLPLQDFSELTNLAGIQAFEIERLRSVMTLAPVVNFNPDTAPNDALAVRFSGSLLDGLLALRASDTLNNLSYAAVIGSGGDEFVVFYPGPALSVSVSVRAGDAMARVTSSLLVRPYEFEPLLPWSLRRQSLAVNGT